MSVEINAGVNFFGRFSYKSIRGGENVSVLIAVISVIIFGDRYENAGLMCHKYIKSF